MITRLVLEDSNLVSLVYQLKTQERNLHNTKIFIIIKSEMKFSFLFSSPRKTSAKKKNCLLLYAPRATGISFNNFSHKIWVPENRP